MTAYIFILLILMISFSEDTFACRKDQFGKIIESCSYSDCRDKIGRDRFSRKRSRSRDHRDHRDHRDRGRSYDKRQKSFHRYEQDWNSGNSRSQSSYQSQTSSIWTSHAPRDERYLNSNATKNSGVATFSEDIPEDCKIDKILGRFHKKWANETDVLKVTAANIIKLGKRGNSEASYKLLEQLIKNGITPTLVIYNVVINSYAREGDSEGTHRVFQEMKEKGLNPDEFTYNTLLNVYAQRGDTEGAHRVFQEMKNAGFSSDEIAYATLTNAYARGRDPEGAHATFQEMKEKGFNPDESVYNTLLNAYVQGKNSNGANSIFQEMKEKGFNPDEITYSSMINAYVQNNEIDSALKIFDEQIGKIYSKLNLESDILDFHANIFYTEAAFNSLQKSGLIKQHHIDGVPSAIVFVAMTWRKNSQRPLPSKIVVGQHGGDILRDTVQRFLNMHKISFEVDSENSGVILVPYY